MWRGIDVLLLVLAPSIYARDSHNLPVEPRLVINTRVGQLQTLIPVHRAQ